MNQSCWQRTKILLSLVFCSIFATSQAGSASNDKTLSRLTGAAKTYFRDTTELPMKVEVRTVVVDTSGKNKKQFQGSIDFAFHGYNPRSGKATDTTTAGFFARRTMKESMAGNNAVAFAGLLLKDALSGSTPPEIQQSAGPDQPLVVKINNPKCELFKLRESAFFPENYCGHWEYHLMDSAGDLKFERFSFDSTGLPAEARVAYLGDVQVLTFHFDEDFQQIFLPGDPEPFLLPKQVVTTITTSKGTITITNQYTPRNPKAMPPS